MAAYNDLMAFQRETEALSQVAGRLGWDQETMMPRDAAPQRGEEMAAMETVLHARRTDPRIADWLAQAETSGEVEVAQVRQIKRSYDRASKVPAKLASQIARVTSEAQGAWAAAREADDFAAFAPVLKDVVSLKRKRALRCRRAVMSMMPCLTTMNPVPQRQNCPRCLMRCARDW